MAKELLLDSQLWIVLLLSWLLLLSAVLSDTEPDRHHYKRRKGSSSSRDRRPHKSKYSSDHSKYKSQLGLQGQRDQTTLLPQFLPDIPRTNMPDPSFMPEDKKIEASIGDRATLPCTVQHLGARQVSWKKQGDPHFLSVGTDIWVQDANLRIEHNSYPAKVSNWNMQFHSVTMKDKGFYRCEVISTEKLVWVVELVVLEKPRHKPEISIEGKQFVESGQRVYLRCNTTEGDMIPDDVDWFKDGDKIEDGLFPGVLITKYVSKEKMTLVSELSIDSGNSKDSGTYICRSSTPLIASLEVNVLVGKKADSANVKRGTGTSSTRTQYDSGQSVGCSIMYQYLPFFQRNPLVFLVAVAVLCVTRNLL